METEADCFGHDRKEAWTISTGEATTIHLFKADYNWVLGNIVGRRMVYSARPEAL